MDNARRVAWPGWLVGGALGLTVVMWAGWQAWRAGWWRPVTPDVAVHAVWGVDVSHHQGAVDWVALAGHHNLQFAYLKATEGGDFTDRRYAQNLEAARAAGLKVGAYHFFTFCRPVEEQVAHHLRVATPTPDMLPPALDVELGGNCQQVPAPQEVRARVTAWMNAVREKTGRTPLLYLTPEAWRRFYGNRDTGWPLWLRSVWTTPASGSGWTLWQFANRARVDGVTGPVDLNTFVGTRAALDTL